MESKQFWNLEFGLLHGMQFCHVLPPWPSLLEPRRFWNLARRGWHATSSQFICGGVSGPKCLLVESGWSTWLGNLWNCFPRQNARLNTTVLWWWFLDHIKVSCAVLGDRREPIGRSLCNHRRGEQLALSTVSDIFRHAPSLRSMARPQKNIFDNLQNPMGSSIVQEHLVMHRAKEI